MQRNFEKSAQFTASREGLYQCNRADPGNWTGGQVGHGALVGTMRGISAPVMVRWLHDPDMVSVRVMQSITQETFSAIARTLYWRAINGDELPAGVDLMLFDFAFNSGVARAAKQLQRVLGMDAKQIDGDIDDVTLEAVFNMSPGKVLETLSDKYRRKFQADLGVTVDGDIGPETINALFEQKCRWRVLIYALATQQEAAYRSFRGFPQFGRGWLGRLDARVQAALQLAYP